MNPVSKTVKARERCRSGSKAVNAACVKSMAVVSMQVPAALQDDLSYARDYLMVLPQRIREVEEAAEAVLREGECRKESKKGVEECV